MRERLTFSCEGARCAASLDRGTRTEAGLLIVSGGNETLAGAHRGMAWVAAAIATEGYPVFRYDRRGVGDSCGDNRGYLSSASDIKAAAEAFRAATGIRTLVAFGNCDAATALALYAQGAGVDRLILANPWTYDDDGNDGDDEATALPPASAIRARYLARLKDPRQLWRLVSGGVDIRKLVSGLRAARGGRSAKDGVAKQLFDALGALHLPTTILLAARDRTALAFAELWKDAPQAVVQAIAVHRIETASHGFADDAARDWLLNQLKRGLG